MAKPGAQRGGRSGGSAWSTRQLLKDLAGRSRERASGTHSPLRPNVVLPACMRTFYVLLTNAHGAREEYPEKNGPCGRSCKWLASRPIYDTPLSPHDGPLRWGASAASHLLSHCMRVLVLCLLALLGLAVSRSAVNLASKAPFEPRVHAMAGNSTVSLDVAASLNVRLYAPWLRVGS
jgi:hypothetical protein